MIYQYKNLLCSCYLLNFKTSDFALLLNKIYIQNCSVAYFHMPYIKVDKFGGIDKTAKKGKIKENKAQ